MKKTSTVTSPAPKPMGKCKCCGTTCIPGKSMCEVCERKAAPQKGC